MAMPPIGDRLSSTLFVAALFHGVVILGVTFTAGSLTGDTLPVLNVTLVVDTAELSARPEEAEFLANRDQLAAGKAAKGLRPTTALSADQPFTQPGDPTGADLADGTPRDPAPSAEQVVSRGRSERVRAQPQPTDDPAAVPQRAAAQNERLVPQTTATEVGLRAELPGGDDDSRTLVATPSTQQSILAEYLDGWRRRVERIGNANYPAEFLGGRHAGRPTLEVVIASDGRLEDILVRRSSGDKALDQAALKILRLAAPFEPLPENIRRDYDELRFAYEWEFFDGARAGGSEAAQAGRAAAAP